jgi:hypothetical protein
MTPQPHIISVSVDTLLGFDAGDQTQGLKHARQAFCHLSLPFLLTCP